jgi:hypothetical protein
LDVFWGVVLELVGVVFPLRFPLPLPLPPPLPLPLPFPPGLGVVVVGVVLGVVVEGETGGGHDSLTLLAGPGRLRDDRGAPGASWKVRTCPVSRVTVTVQSAAELGSAATADTASTVLADASASLSFRCLNTLALSPPAVPSPAKADTPSKRRT